MEESSRRRRCGTGGRAAWVCADRGLPGLEAEDTMSISTAHSDQQIAPRVRAPCAESRTRPGSRKGSRCPPLPTAAHRLPTAVRLNPHPLQCTPRPGSGSGSDPRLLHRLLTAAQHARRRHRVPEPSPSPSPSRSLALSVSRVGHGHGHGHACTALSCLASKQTAYAIPAFAIAATIAADSLLFHASPRLRR